MVFAVPAKLAKKPLKDGCAIQARPGTVVMPQFHVYAHYIKQGDQSGGAVGFARYMDRSEAALASQAHRYIDRQTGIEKRDLVAHGVDHLPTWARDGAHFWAMADQHERHGYIVGRQLEIALPRELSDEGRLALADDLRSTLVPGLAHSWAIHNPPARDQSGEMPHLHVLYSPRRDDGVVRTAERWFQTAAAHDKDPTLGGARKDPHLERKAFLYSVRAAVETLSNAALEREGLPCAVSARSLEARGLSRDTLRYDGKEKTVEQSRAQREQLRMDGTFDREQSAAYVDWRTQRTQVPSLERADLVAYLQQQVWGEARTVVRAVQQAREQTLEPSSAPEPPATPEPPPTPVQETLLAREPEVQQPEAAPAPEAQPAPQRDPWYTRAWQWVLHRLPSWMTTTVESPQSPMQLQQEPSPPEQTRARTIPVWEQRQHQSSHEATQEQEPSPPTREQARDGPSGENVPLWQRKAEQVREPEQARELEAEPERASLSETARRLRERIDRLQAMEPEREQERTRGQDRGMGW